MLDPSKNMNQVIINQQSFNEKLKKILRKKLEK